MQNKRKRLAVIDSPEDIFAKMKKFPHPVVILREDSESIWIEDRGIEIKLKKTDLTGIHLFGYTTQGK